MITFSSNFSYWLYRKPTDMRKSFDGLSHLVVTEMKRQLFSGEVFIFFNKPRNLIKLLIWDRSGFVIYYKRLEKGNMELPKTNSPHKTQELKWEELVMILEGIKLDSIKRKKRYNRLN